MQFTRTSPRLLSVGSLGITGGNPWAILVIFKFTDAPSGGGTSQQPIGLGGGSGVYNHFKSYDTSWEINGSNAGGSSSIPGSYSQTYTAGAEMAVLWGSNGGTDTWISINGGARIDTAVDWGSLLGDRDWLTGIDFGARPDYTYPANVLFRGMAYATHATDIATLKTNAAAITADPWALWTQDATSTRTISFAIDKVTAGGNTVDLHVFSKTAPYFGTLVQTISGVSITAGTGTQTVTAAATNQSLALGTTDYPTLMVKASQVYNGTANPFYSGLGFASVIDV
jgi:hypothetical protein